MITHYRLSTVIVSWYSLGTVCNIQRHWVYCGKWTIS